MIVYKLFNIVTGKSYIGQTVQPLRRRLSAHASKISPWPIGRSIKKYGIENFDIKTLCHCSSKEELDKQETFYINYYNTIRPNGYNLTYGGEGTIGYRHSEETKRKLSVMNKGKKLTEEQKKKLSISQIGIKKPGTAKYVKEKNTCWWRVITPDNKELIIRDMKDFCKKNGLDQGTMSRVASGKRHHYKQYKCVKLGGLYVR
jgi:group I intron endonuclease